MSAALIHDPGDAAAQADTAALKRGQRNVRKAPARSPDYFPTPPWATRAFFEYGLLDLTAEHGEEDIACDEVWDPACGGGHMAEILKETQLFANVFASDLYDWGYGDTGRDFLSPLYQVSPFSPGGAPAIVTNPPFNVLDKFLEAALAFPNAEFVAMLYRSNALAGKARQAFYERPDFIGMAQFAGRVQMCPETWDPESHSQQREMAWFLWTPGRARKTRLPALSSIPFDAVHKLTHPADTALYAGPGPVPNALSSPLFQSPVAESGAS